jgi:sialate O-acetylesterase
MVVTLDIATVMNIHPPFKKEVGERLANLALAKDYDRDVVSQGPVFESMKAEGRRIRVMFGNTEGGLMAGEGGLSEFEIAGPDGKYHKADARIEGDEVLLTSNRVTAPLSVRYCWRNGAEASLFGKSGLPANQFRSGKGN